jgi:hypothetical protein
MSGSPISAKNLWVNASPVIPDMQPELRLVIPNFHFDLVRQCVTKGITQRLGGNPVDFIA